MRTTGLGGDSEVHFVAEGLQGGVTLGPRRVLPISLIAHEAPDVVMPALEAQLRSATPGEYDGRFIRAVPGVERQGLGPREDTLLDRIGQDVWPLASVLRTRLELGALTRLIDRGLVQVSGATPSDASHVLGTLDVWNTDAARAALLLFGRRRTGSGEQLGRSAEAVAQMVVEQLTHQTGLALLETAFSEETTDFGLPPDVLARHVLMQRGLQNHAGVVRINTGLNLPVVGLGASATSYYPAVGALMGAEMILPEHAGVANAIGAVVGRVTMRSSGSVTSPSEGRYRVHLETGPEDFADADLALARLEDTLRQRAIMDAQSAGAADIQVRTERDMRTAAIDGCEVFVEGVLTVEASGRPRVADG